jgi:hypothetical protein
VFDAGPFVVDSVAGSEEQAANETPRVPIVSKREALLVFLIVVGPEAVGLEAAVQSSERTLFGNATPR